MPRFLTTAGLFLFAMLILLVDVKAQTQEPEEKIFLVAEEPAEYPGGLDAMYVFIAGNLKYPTSARRSNVQGMVYVSFVVEKDGSVSNIWVVKGINQECDAEAARVVSLFPHWKPGRNEGKEVRSKFVLPIKYHLTGKKK